MKLYHTERKGVPDVPFPPSSPASTVACKVYPLVEWLMMGMNPDTWENAKFVVVYVFGMVAALAKLSLAGGGKK